jgi:sec-independent protein translocase protein TatA
MGELGLPELIIILLLVFVLFGANKLPQVGEGLGKAIRNFKDAASGKDEPPTSRTQPGPGGTQGPSGSGTKSGAA